MTKVVTRIQDISYLTFGTTSKEISLIYNLLFCYACWAGCQYLILQLIRTQIQVPCLLFTGDARI